MWLVPTLHCFHNIAMSYEQAWARLDGYYQIMSEQINLYWEPFPKNCVELHGTVKSSLYWTCYLEQD